MAYSNQFLKFTFIYQIDGTDEIADTSINYTTAPGWSGASAALSELVESDLASMAGDMITMYGVTGGRWADYSSLKAVKAAAIDVGGHYLADPLLWEDPTPTEGTTIGNPAQATTVISLRSGFSLGGGNMGRMYLPHFYMSGLTNSPFTDQGQAQGLANAAAAAINSMTEAINDSVTAVLFPAIMSQASGGSSKGVTEVRVGNVTDTQRRRRQQLRETYSVATLS